MTHERNFIPLAQAAPPLFAGIDLGGTNIKAGVVDDRGHPLSWHSVPTHVERGPDAGALAMADAVRQACAQAGIGVDRLARVGLGSPGTMDLKAGLLLQPNNLPGWWDFPLRDRVAGHLGRPVSFANDASAAAYGEFWVGSGRKFHSMIMFTLGTGVGGGIIVGNLSIDGEHGAGAELGHIIIDYHDDARLCTCGGRGHLEAYASATALVRRTEEALAAGRGSSLARRIASPADLTPLVIAEEAQRGDALALELIRDTARFLGIGAVSVMHTIDPDGVIIGGAMTFGGHATELGRMFLARVREEVQARAFPPLAEVVCVDYASLGGDAGYIGAAGVARTDLQTAK